jgi:hypothetical protein
LSQTGSLDVNYRIAKTGNKPGYIIHGPYVDLPKGKYRATIYYTAKMDATNTEGEVGFWEFGSWFPNQNVLFHKAPLYSNESKASVETTITGETVKNAEIRAFYSGKDTLIIHEVTFERISD